MENDELFTKTTKEIAQKRADLAIDNMEAWRNFSKTIFKAGAIDEKTKQLIAIAVAHTTQCPYCIKAHTKQALQKGVTEKEIMEAIWVASEMRAGAAIAHSNIAIAEMNHFEDRNK